MNANVSENNVIVDEATVQPNIKENIYLIYGLSNKQTFSVWLVIGNMSTGCTTMVL